VLDRDDLSDNRRKYYAKILQPLLKRFVQARENGDQTTIAAVQEDAREIVAADTRYALLARVALRAVLESV
jgi:hypothetical protein